MKKKQKHKITFILKLFLSSESKLPDHEIMKPRPLKTHPEVLTWPFSPSVKSGEPEMCNIEFTEISAKGH